MKLYNETEVQVLLPVFARIVRIGWKRARAFLRSKPQIILKIRLPRGAESGKRGLENQNENSSLRLTPHRRLTSSGRRPERNAKGALVKSKSKFIPDYDGEIENEQMEMGFPCANW